ncbi:MAG: type II/IV secretion system ATPase subunit [Candidatus Aenigmatarchaeota archaeon]
MEDKNYKVIANHVKAEVSIYQTKEDYVPRYDIKFPEVEESTQAILDSIKEDLIENVGIKARETLDSKAMEDIKVRFLKEANKLIEKELPKLEKDKQKSLAGRLVHNMLGLGNIEILINDDSLEEIVINSAKEPVWVYHKEYGWLKTTLKLENEGEIYNYSTTIGRKVGRQITNLNPLMDAHLTTGDRVNATLFPISTNGNTITIRKFARNPWTITHFIDPEHRTLNKEIASLLWLAIQYEMNMIVAGGTASGKTSLLNTLAPFIPPTHRIVSIEDTREIRLPDFLHWVPMTTREPNPEGKGEVSMNELMVNSLRMRPDRIIVGEIRRQKQAEVLFEAMHTGHSVYSTLHANTANEVVRRMTNPPINLPENMLEALNIACVQFRDRRRGIRRTYQLAEIVQKPSRGDSGISLDVNVMYRWKGKNDRIEKIKDSVRLMNDIQMHTGMSQKEIEKDLQKKQEILQWMLDNRINTVNTVGKIMADYYKDDSRVYDFVEKNKKPEQIFNDDLLQELKKSE